MIDIDCVTCCNIS